MKKEFFIFPSWKYNKGILDNLKINSTFYKNICYLTLNKSYLSVIKLLDSQSIKSSKFYFVDGITPTILKRKPTKQCLFVDSLNLSKLADKILNVIKVKKMDALVFDSLSTLLIHKTDKEVVEFFNYLISFLEKLDVSILIYCLDEDRDSPAAKQIKMLVDRTETVLV